MLIYLDQKSMNYKEEIIKIIDHQIDYNPNFIQEEYEIFEDEHNWIDNCDEMKGTLLLDIITGFLYKKLTG